MPGNNRKTVILQDRDLHFMRELASILRVADREQAKLVAGFTSTTRANARLLALTNGGFLRRFFWGTVGGARKAIYALTPKGAALVGLPLRGPRRSRDQILAADSYSLHQLEINEVYCALRYRPTPDGTSVIRWIAFAEPIRGTAIKPDGYAELRVLGQPVTLFFEIDLGSEHRSVWQAKVRSYLAYATSGDFERQFGQQRFRALVVVTSESRLKLLQTATAELTEKIFRFTTAERIKRQSFWGAIWQKPRGSEQLPLFPNS
jgi:hypothetical protein